MSNDLKTLKEIYEEQCDFWDSKIEINSFNRNIRAEAIKWVKHYTDKANEWLPNEGEEDMVKFFLAKRLGLVEFFNLTEDDLNRAGGEG